MLGAGVYLGGGACMVQGWGKGIQSAGMYLGSRGMQGCIYRVRACCMGCI